MIATVADVSAATSQNGGSTGAIDTTGASLIEITVASFSGGSGLGVSDSKSNTWFPLSSAASGDSRIQKFYTYATSVGSGHTFTVSGTSVYAVLMVRAYSGTNISFHSQATATASAVTSLNAGSVTPPENGSLVTTGICLDNSFSGLSISGESLAIIDSHAYSGGVNMGGGNADQVQATAGAINPQWSWTSSRTVAGCTACYFEADDPPLFPAFVQTDDESPSASGDDVSVAFAGSVTSGNLLVAFGSIASGAAASTVTDTRGFTWQEAHELTGANPGVSVWYTIASSSGACTVTMTWPSSDGVVRRLRLLEYALDGETVTEDVSAGANAGPTSTHAAGSLSPTVAQTFAILGVQFTSGFGISADPSGYVLRINDSTRNLRIYEGALTSTSAVNPTITTTTSNDTSGTVHVVFKRGAGGGGTGATRLVGGRLIGGRLVGGILVRTIV